MLKSTLPTEMSFENIRYSMVWEDPRNLKLGLQVCQEDDVLCIGSAGCNAFALALESPRRLVVIDLSPAQIALVKLKVKAIESLDYDDFINLIGLYGPTSRRQSLYESLVPRLDGATKKFWSDRLEIVESGISESGRLDQYLKMFREEKIGLFFSPGMIAELVGSSNRETQEAILEKIDLTAFKEVVFQFFGREPLARFARDPAQFRFVDQADLQTEVWRRFLSIFSRTEVKTNYFLRYFLTGKYPYAEGVASPYLLRENYARLKAEVSRIEVIETDLESFLQADAGRNFSKIALSDIFEYVSEDHADRIFSLIGNVLPDHGRLAYWNLFIDRQAKESSRLLKLSDLSETLSKNDLLWLYQNFNVYEKAAP